MIQTDERTVSLKKGTEETPRVILFVCTGNTCRSPMAAALFNDMMRPREVCSACADEMDIRMENAVARSAGLYANEGDPITQEAARALREAGVRPVPGYDYNAHRARTVTADMMAEAHRVIAISAAHAMELTFRFPEYAAKISTMPMDIADPFGRGDAVYRECLMQLRYCLQLLMAEESAQ